MCDNFEGKRRYNKCGNRLYIEPLCNSCTSDLIEVGWDVTLTPNNVVPSPNNVERWINYPILKGLCGN